MVPKGVGNCPSGKVPFRLQGLAFGKASQALGSLELFVVPCAIGGLVGFLKLGNGNWLMNPSGCRTTENRFSLGHSGPCVLYEEGTVQTVGLP